MIGQLLRFQKIERNQHVRLTHHPDVSQWRDKAAKYRKIEVSHHHRCCCADLQCIVGLAVELILSCQFLHRKVRPRDSF